MTLLIPQLKKPTLKELKKTYPWIKSIESDTSPTQQVSLEILNLVRGGEKHIPCEEYTKRREGLPLLGYQQAAWLVQHQDDDGPEFEAFRDLRWTVYIDFPATVVVSADGDRGFAYLDEHGVRWYLDWRGVGDDLRQDGRVASARKQFLTPQPPALEPQPSDTLPLCLHQFCYSHIQYPPTGTYTAIPPNKEVVICRKCGELRKTNAI